MATLRQPHRWRSSTLVIGLWACASLTTVCASRVASLSPDLSLSRAASTSSLQTAPQKSVSSRVTERAECNVTDYGAVPGNQTRDAPGNAAALTRALAQCTLVRVPPGVYKLTPVSIPSHRVCCVCLYVYVCVKASHADRLNMSGGRV